MSSLLQTLHWREPWWLLLALQPWLLILLNRLTYQRRQQPYADKALLPWVIANGKTVRQYHVFRQLVLGLAWLLLAMGMAGPRLPLASFNNDTSKYTNIMIVLDVSRSMAARDIAPSRIERARLELHDFINQAQQARIGITLFSGRAHLLSPLTSDKQLLRYYLDSLKTGMLPTEGSNLTDALTFAAKQLTNNNNHISVILLVSDGESLPANRQLSRLVTTIRQNSIHLFSLGIGTSQGANLPGENGWLDDNGQQVISRLNEQALRDLATQGNGQYSLATDNNADWQVLYDQGIARLNPDTVTTQAPELVVWKELYPWCLLLSFACFAIVLVKPTHIATGKQLTLMLLLCLLLTNLPSNSYASNQSVDADYQKAYRAYRDGDYISAKKLFSQLAGFDARLGEGNAAYRQQQYQQAASLFIQATLDARTNEQQAKALFNLANSYFKLENYQQAATIYEDVLRYQPTLKAAQTNLAHAQQQIQLAIDQQSPNAFTTRAGRGPRSARASEGMDVGNSSLTLADDQDNAASLPGNNEQARSNGKSILPNAELASTDISKQTDNQWDYTINNVASLAQQNPVIQVDESLYWQRLFGFEEGFAAPVDTPRNRPELKPW